MDIISMQIANKVLKRMNTEFNGAYDIFVATGGQKVFTTTKPHDITNHGLHVYVNGYHGVEGTDYTHQDQYNVEFKQGLNKGDIVLLSTQIVGIPKFEVINPAYDDTTIKSELLALGNRITTVINALDEDSDGSIIDTIADIKKQWLDADGNLMLLIEQKASAEEFLALKAVVEGIIVPPAYDDTELFAKVNTMESAVTLIEQKVQEIEANTSPKELFVSDEETGRKHKLVLRSGLFYAQAVGLPLEISQTGPVSGTLNEVKEFRLNIVANADLNQKAKLVVAHNGKVKLEFNNTEVWEPFTTRTIESLTNIAYTLRVTGLETGTHEVRFDILKFDNNTELGTTAFSIQVTEPPSSIVSGVVSLDGAATNLVTISVKESTELETVSVAVQEGGAYAHKLLKGGTYAVSVVNGTDTHDVSGEVSKEIVVDLGTNYQDNNFTLTKKIVTVPTEQERVMALLQDSTTSEITLAEDITLTDFVLGCNKTLNLNSLSARLDGATNVDTFKITSIGGGAVYFDSNFTLTGDGESGIIIDNSEASVSYRMGTLAAIPEGYIWEEGIFKKVPAEPIRLMKKGSKK